MNEHQPFRSAELRVPPDQIITAADEQQALLAVRASGRRALRQVVLSDFDITLCNTYAFDQATNNHLPSIDPELAGLVRGKPLVVATARRARHPALRTIRTALLPSPWLPVIAENGGVTLTGPYGELVRNFVDDEQIQTIHTWADSLARQVKLPTGRRFVVKHGDTLSIVRLQANNGDFSIEDQDRLQEQLESLDKPEHIRIEHGGTSLTVQDGSVNKAAAFRTFLGSIGVARDDICVIGLGDADNDASIFAEADLSIGVHPRVKHLVDISMSRGIESTKELFKLRSTRWFDLARMARLAWEQELIV